MVKLISSLFILVSLFSCSEKVETKEDALAKISKLSDETMIIETRHGVIELKFYPKAAPKTVARISELVKQGFYNGLKFHRVIPNFVAQGGDPKGNGTGGSGIKLKAEFNAIPHEPGTLSMARASDPNSADSQFYICLARLPHLDNKYTVFGKVIKGMDAVLKIQPNDLMEKVYLK